MGTRPELGNADTKPELSARTPNAALALTGAQLLLVPLGAILTPAVLSSSISPPWSPLPMGPAGLVELGWCWLGGASRKAQDVPAGTHCAHRAVTESPR